MKGFVLVFVAASLVGCAGGVRGFENATADLFAPLGGLPREARELEDRPLNEVVIFGAGGFQEYEIARRFELGVGGLPQDMTCALIWYDRSGRVPVQIREPAPYGGFTTVSYLGFSHARLAVRRLNRDGHGPDPENAAGGAQRCRDLVTAASANAPAP